VLLLLAPGEFERFTDLRLRLRVNGALRQEMSAADMNYSPLQALQALARFQRLEPGDLLLTGTPAGTALSAASAATDDGAIDLGTQRNVVRCAR
jgi:2-keto-4-pentenoate hydratase/2-oxohepta-3-ene-1,7-dioic acid hydratase in catechol pathway